MAVGEVRTGFDALQFAQTLQAEGFINLVDTHEDWLEVSIEFFITMEAVSEQQ